MFSKILIVFFATCALAKAVNPPLVFVHGIKGAVLTDDNGKRRWVTGLQTLGIGGSGLALPMEWKDGAQPKDNIKATSVLDSIRIIPFLFEAQIYGPWTKQAMTFGRPYHAFYYDWRRDNLETLAELETFLDGVTKHSGQKAQVVAHSMGGLLTMALLNARPELFQAVVFAGVPFGGGIGFLPDLHVGEKTGLNGRILSWKTMSTFPAPYVFLPSEGQPLLNKEGTPIAMDFFNVEDWRAQGFSYFHEADPEAAVYEKFLETTLAHAKTFREKLRPTQTSYPQVVAVISRSTPTLACAIKDGPKSKRGWDFSTCPKENGDGRVIARLAVPPKGVPYRTVESTAEHADLLNDPQVIDLVRNLP